MEVLVPIKKKLQLKDNLEFDNQNTKHLENVLKKNVIGTTKIIEVTNYNLLSNCLLHLHHVLFKFTVLLAIKY